MKRGVLFFAISASIIFSHCKKNEGAGTPPPGTVDTPRNSFKLIATNNVKWVIASQGMERQDSIFHNYYLDTNFHSWTIITGSGEDTLIDTVLYHAYDLKYYQAPPNTVLNPMYIGRIYTREDTTANKVYMCYWFGNVFTYEREILDFNQPAGDTLAPWAFFPWSKITKNATISIEGIQQDLWQFQQLNSTQKYFWQCRGIGSSVGIGYRTDYEFAAGQVRSLDFIYKTDSIHFDYPLYY